MKLLTIIGARPQIIKSAALSRVVRRDYVGTIEHRILHTGQHYDRLMSEVFFEEMGIPVPDYNLNVGSGAHATQTARMLEGITEVLEQESPDGVIIFGDTNSTLAGALASSRMQIPLFHVEAGLRSYYMPMPEEQNRIVSDHLSNICFAPTNTAMQNLVREGLADSPSVFGNRRQKREAVLCGDVMLDNVLHYSTIAARHDILHRHSLTPYKYLLATIHRDFNTDTPKRMASLLSALYMLGTSTGMPVIIPAHPRTAVHITQWLSGNENALQTLKIIPPVSYLDMLALEQAANTILTDSGGVQKEAYFCQRPCIILRHETEWNEIVEQKSAILADDNPHLILESFEQLQKNPGQYPPLFGDGHASEHIIRHIINYLK